MQNTKSFWRVAALTLPLVSQLNADPPPGSFTLTFEEEFNTSTIDGGQWKVGPADAFIEGVGGNNVDSYSVSAGALSMEASDEDVDFSFATYDYSGAELTTFMRFKQKYGYFEARMKWDAVQGMWPAFWLMPERDEYGIEEYTINSYLKFDLSASGISSVSSATLRIKSRLVGNSASEPNNLQLFRVSDDSWLENTITYNNRPVWDPLFIEQKFGYDAPTDTFVEFDVTEYVNLEVGSDGVVSLALADEFRRARGQFFHSKEAADSADRPQLVVDGQIFYPSDDAMVKWGASANSNYGTDTEIHVRSSYHNDTDSTSVVTDGSQGMEIDVMESLGVWGANEVSHALHWDGYGSNHQQAGWGHAPSLDVTQYHTYGVYWEDGLLEFYVDGVKTATHEDSRVMDVPAYLLLSLQVGGWDGNDPSSAINGNSVEIDWVRAWSGDKTGSVASATTLQADGSVVFGSDYTVYGGTGNTGSVVTLADDGEYFAISKNGWMKFPLNYTVTADTWIEFTVESAEEGEILAIGLEENDDINDAQRLFQVAGSQTWANAIQDANTYPVDAQATSYVINVGASYTGAMTYLAVSADNDNDNKNYGRFSNVRIYEGAPSGGGSGGTTIDVGILNKGIAGLDERTGSGYLMYSVANVITRFGAYVDNAEHFIAVYYNGTDWYADTNFGQVQFSPAATDILLATVDFTNDTVTSLEGSEGTEYGIEYGYASGDIVFTADYWNGAANDGEFGISGTSFTTNGTGAAPIDIGAVNNGVAAVDGRTGAGYLMYSEANVITRFGAYTGNADLIIAVYYSNGQWYADTNFGQSAFTPVSTDRLLASVDFSNDTATSLEGTVGTVDGIDSGYTSGDLVFAADYWNGSSNDGEFGVTGTFFTP